MTPLDRLQYNLVRFGVQLLSAMTEDERQQEREKAAREPRCIIVDLDKCKVPSDDDNARFDESSKWIENLMTQDPRTLIQNKSLDMIWKALYHETLFYRGERL